jgi:halogenation protein CepH
MSDILVAGGGPAGAAAARLLALWGHDVRVVTLPDTTAPRRVLAESLPPSCRKLFDVIGITDSIDSAGFIRSTGNTVWWGDQSTRTELFANGQRGWQVTTEKLAALLLASARAAGVNVSEARITPSDVDAAPESIVLDCTGRNGVVGRARGWRQYESSLKTVALVGVWRRTDEWDLDDGTHTLIESYVDGWMWSVPVAGPSTLRYVAAMVDPRSTELAPAAARAVYLAEIAKTRRFARLLSDATLERGPAGWDASMYSSTSYADDRVLLVGDAGSFIDPLSSAGVKKALASGWLAAVAAHTALVRPALRTTAFRFFESRERDIYTQFRALTQRFLAEAAVGHAHPFWGDRIGGIEQAADDDTPADAVARAFDRLRSSPTLALRRAETVRVEDRPAVDGCEIVLQRRVVKASGEGVRYLHDVDVVALLDMAPQFDDVGMLFDAYVRQQAPVAPPDFLTALAAVVANGWLAWRE